MRDRERETDHTHASNLAPHSFCVRQLPNQGRIVDGVANPMCTEDMDRSAFTFPVFEYCHQSFQDTNLAQTGGADICGDRSLVGRAVIGEYGSPQEKEAPNVVVLLVRHVHILRRMCFALLALLCFALCCVIWCRPATAIVQVRACERPAPVSPMQPRVHQKRTTRRVRVPRELLQRPP